jgi:hypothetical protein
MRTMIDLVCNCAGFLIMGFFTIAAIGLFIIAPVMWLIALMFGL